MGSRPLVIIGAGPTGLGAGYRLRELGYDDWVILEADRRVGGLAGSVTDEEGFTYDIGGHVLFSDYPYYTALVDRMMGDEFTELGRQAWVWMENRYIPYPFQNHIGRLSPETVYDCVVGLFEAQRRQRRPPEHFGDWIRTVFGEGIAHHFMLPYNHKVWATPPELMDYSWIAERVPVVDLRSVLRNVLLGDDQSGWGPNKTFRYPLHGGTGALYERMAARLRDRLHLDRRVVSVDPVARTVTTGDGRVRRYSALLSTMPLDDLIGLCECVPDRLQRAAGRLMSSGTHVVGVGLDRPAGSDKNWIYYPEPDVPFYRVTYLSNYSPYMTARPEQTLLLAETSTSRHKREDPSDITERVIDGFVRVGLMEHSDRNRIVTTWRCSPPKTYPIPTLDRDAALSTIEPWLEAHGIASRGRFGAWRYEIGNMDHSCMQGVEWVNHVLCGKQETVWTPAAA